MHITARDYARALGAIGVTEHQIAMLRTHYDAPRQALTPEEMSAKLGWPNGGSSHLHYGRLARKVRERLGLPAAAEGFSEGEGGDEEQLAALVTIEREGGRAVWVLRPELAQALEMLGWIDLAGVLFPDETRHVADLFEGTETDRAITAYRRAAEARERCLAAHGLACAVCSVRLEEVYGELARGAVEVHNLVPLSRIGGLRLDPVRDLRPVCPSCHRMLHRREPPLAIEELRLAIETQRRSRGG